jgi:hypothetical protein
MKHYRKYPYGILIKPVARKPYCDSTDPLYEISDDNNKRKRIRLSQLMHLAATNQYAVSGYPRATIITDSGSRNKYVKNSSGAYVKVYNGPGRNGRKQLDIPPLDNRAHYAKFTIIQDGTELPHMKYEQSKYVVPIESINGDEYYGREDCRNLIAEPLDDIPPEDYHLYN